MNTLSQALQARKNAFVLVDTVKQGIAKNGWTKGTMDMSKKKCLLITICNASCDRDTKDALYNAIVEDSKLRKRISYDMVKSDTEMVIEFNDHPDTTLEDVNDLLDRTKARLECMV